MYEEFNITDGGKRVSGRYVVRDGLVTVTAARNAGVDRRLHAKSGDACKDASASVAPERDVDRRQVTRGNRGLSWERPELNKSPHLCRS